ncbi:elongation factor P [Candidatus Shapirobacteria bacterium]|nr:elongation factor P [Candidatus Shapirobacteria bacterium]
MISVTEMKASRLLQIEGVPYQVVDYKHTKVGRGNASIRLKMRNLKNGSVLERTFNSGAKVEPIQTEVKKAQYLYHDDKDYYFMEPQTFEQVSLPQSLLVEKGKFLKEGQDVKILFWNEDPLGLELPLTLAYEVKETNPGVKGNSVVASFKPAVLENGLRVKVPLFVDVGDRIKVDTRSGEYVERVG